MTPLRRMLCYAAFIAAVAAVTVWWDGDAIDPARAAGAALLVPVFAFVIWLRWDWAPAEGRKRREERARRREEWLRSRERRGE